MLDYSEAPEYYLPRYYTKSISNVNYLPVVELIASQIVANQGLKKGQPIRLSFWQKWIISLITELINGKLRFSFFLLMLPKKNGKTFLMSLLVLVHLLTAPSHSMIYSAAVDLKSARYVFDNIVLWIEGSPYLSSLFTIKDRESKIINNSNGVIYEALASNSGQNRQGLQPYVVIIDELHVWEALTNDARAKQNFDNLTKGSGALPEAQVLVISTAGANLHNSLLGGLYLRALKELANPEENLHSGFASWEIDPDEDDPLDPISWRKANPAIDGGTMRIDYLRESLARSSATGIAGFLRYHLGVWARQEGSPFMIPHFWNNAKVDQQGIEPGRKVVCGFDASRNKDCTAIVIQDYETGFLWLESVWEKPSDAPEDWHIPRSEVIAAVEAIFQKYDVIVMYADRYAFEFEIKEWRGRGMRVESYTQSHERIRPAATAFRDDIIEKRISHGGQEVFTKHVLNAITDERYIYRKPGGKASREKIDSLAAAVMANNARNFYKLREERQKQKAQALSFL